MEIYRANIKEHSSSLKHALQESYPTDLNMYLDIPTGLIDIEQFQELAVERVKLLKVFESVNLKNTKDLSFKDQVINEATKQNIKFFMPLIKGYTDYEARRLDHLSHFILRLHYCRSDECRRWFIARELEFFRLKLLNTEKKEDVILFMNKSDLQYTPINDDEKRAYAKDIISSTARNIVLESTNVYKVPFIQVLDLVRGRRVFIKNGFCYVPHQDLNSILNTVFRTRLSNALSQCASYIPTLDGDERLARILKGLHNSNADLDYCIKGKDSIPITALDSLAIKSYPLCMRFMHETFKRTHHLKYNARLQYGLFLKGIGVTLEDSLRFWKDGFTKKEDIDAEKFEKAYAYSIRHNYGKEGKRADYTPHSCVKIIMTNVGPGENHGCPFKHVDANTLKQKLLGYNLNINDVADVISYVNNGHYQLACTRYFEVTHGISNARGVNHPNVYFAESQKLINSKVSGNDTSE